MTDLEQQDERAQLLARIRRLEADVRAAREANERERRSNGSLALELYEARAKLDEFEPEEGESTALEIKTEFYAALTRIGHAMGLAGEFPMEYGYDQLTKKAKALAGEVAKLHRQIVNSKSEETLSWEHLSCRVRELGDELRATVSFNSNSVSAHAQKRLSANLLTNYADILSEPDRLPIPCEEDPNGLQQPEDALARTCGAE
jgi:hypothetical protein